MKTITEQQAQQAKWEKWRADAERMCPPIYKSFDLHKFPKFFSNAIGRWARDNERGREFRSNRSYYIQTLAQRALGHAWDHWGKAKLCDGRPCFVLQPYGVNAQTLAACEHFAAGLGLVCYLDAASQWYPGRTISIIFSEPQASGLLLDRTCVEP